MSYEVLRMNRSHMGRDKVKTGVATLACSVTVEGLTKAAKRISGKYLRFS
jgi:hypothetical protein